MNQTLLSHASYAEMESPTRLRDGQYSNYALGGVAGALHGHRMLSHSGDVGGFVADNAVFPDDSIAVGVLTNQEASGAAHGHCFLPRLFESLFVYPDAAAAAEAGSF